MKHTILYIYLLSMLSCSIFKEHKIANNPPSINYQLWNKEGAMFFMPDSVPNDFFIHPEAKIRDYLVNFDRNDTIYIPMDNRITNKFKDFKSAKNTSERVLIPDTINHFYSYFFEDKIVATSEPTFHVMVSPMIPGKEKGKYYIQYTGWSSFCDSSTLLVAFDSYFCEVKREGKKWKKDTCYFGTGLNQDYFAARYNYCDTVNVKNNR